MNRSASTSTSSRNTSGAGSMRTPVVMRRKERSRKVSVSAKSGPQVFLPGDAVAAHTQRGTSRKQNEDRLSVVVSDEPASEGDVCAVFNVYDGHGGFATAEWLRENFTDLIGKEWSEKQPEYALTSAYLSADKKLLVPQGFMGMGERGRGGSKCGSTVATAVVLRPPYCGPLPRS